MAKQVDTDLEKTKSIMRSLVRMKPKPHEEMKVGKKVAKKKSTPKTGRKA